MIQWTLFGVNTRGICILYILPDNWFFSSYLKFVNDSFSGFFLGQSDLFLFSHVCPLFPTFVPLYSSPFFFFPLYLFSSFTCFPLISLFYLLFIVYTTQYRTWVYCVYYTVPTVLRSTVPVLYSLHSTVHSTYLYWTLGRSCTVWGSYSTCTLQSTRYHTCTERWREVAPYEGLQYRVSAVRHYTRITGQLGLLSHSLQMGDNQINTVHLN